MELHGIMWYCMEWNVIACYSMELHVTAWKCMVLFGIHGIVLCSMTCIDIYQPFSCHTFHGTTHVWVSLQNCVEMVHLNVKMEYSHGHTKQNLLKLSPHRQGEDIAVCLCPDTGNPPCIGQKADLTKIRTVAQGGGYLKQTICCHCDKRL